MATAAWVAPGSLALSVYQREGQAMNLTSPLKRMTIFNRDMEASLALYRDILGFTVIEDKLISGPGNGSAVTPPTDFRPPEGPDLPRTTLQ